MRVLALLVPAMATLAITTGSVLAGPPLTAPAAPSNLSFDGVDRLSWADNSDNEDGFRIVASITGGPFEYRTGPNGNTFTIPPEARIHCPERQSVTYEVSAFNAAGESAAVVLGIAADCALQSPPAAPSDARLLGGVLTWVDNSNYETGFRILVRFSGTTERFQYEVAANVTSFALPEEAVLRCPDHASVGYEVVAFNAAGQSSPALYGPVAALCSVPAPTATPAQPRALPRAGSGGSGGEGAGWLIAALVAAAGIAGFGALRLRMRRH